jgi:hypothetical protein
MNSDKLISIDDADLDLVAGGGRDAGLGIGLTINGKNILEVGVKAGWGFLSAGLSVLGIKVGGSVNVG